ncbi:MAG: RNA polymerase sigma factor [Saprospiraceae bacterium]
MKDQKEIILSKFLLYRDDKPELALKLLMDNYGDVMNGLVSKIIDREEIVEDVLQEGFIKVWKNMSEYNPDKSALFTWLYTIIRNTAIDFLRRENNRKIQGLDSGVYNDMKFSQSSNISDVGLIRNLNTLDPKYKEIIELVYFQGYTQQELANEFKIPLGTVKTRVSTALKILRTILNVFILFCIGIN